MSISFNNYVDITSGVAGSPEIGARELITRIFSANPLIPTNSFAEFTSADEVGSYFGTTSAEYARAAFYFGFLSKANRQPSKISFAAYTPVAVPPSIYGDPTVDTLLTGFQAITAGKLHIQLGASTLTLSGIDLAAVTSYADVATAVTAAIVAAAAGDPVVSGAVVSYDASSPIGANFQLIGGGSAGSGTVAVTAAPSPTTDLGVLLGWETPLTIFSQGSPATSITNTMIGTVNGSTNFATFLFMASFTELQNVELATWLATTNLSFMSLIPVSATSAAQLSAAIVGLAGNIMTLSPLAAEFPEMLPGMILAAADYTQPNAVENYMYQQTGGLTPSVTDNADQAAYDALRVNYYGQTQTNGRQVSFYQRGKITGGNTSPTDINVFANEIWFKSFVGDAWMNTLLSLREIPTNAAGRGTAYNILQGCIDEALFNGVISVGNQAFTPLQIATITNLSGSSRAWQQVQTTGYWFTGDFSSTVQGDGSTEWQFNYTLIYAKNNAIRKIVGVHNLI